MRLCQFLGYLFHDRVQTYGYGFQQFLHFPDLWLYFAIKIHLLVSCFGISGFIGIIFKILQIYAYYLQKISTDLWWYSYDLNGTTPYLGN